MIHPSLSRRIPLQRKTPLRARTRVTPRTVREVVLERDGYRCQARLDGCTGRADHVHHRFPRGRGGNDDTALLLTVCFLCHSQIHMSPAASAARGLLLRAGSAGSPAPAEALDSGGSAGLPRRGT